MTIINNQLVDDESKLRLYSPFYYIPDPDKSEALGLASLFFGEPGTDPTLKENQKRVYAIQEDGSTVPIQQPVSTSAGGVPVYNGSPISLAIVGSYALRVNDSQGAQIYYFPSVENEIGLQVGLGGVVEDILTLAASQLIVIFPRVDLGQSIIDVEGPTIDSRSLFRDIDYIITDGANGELTLTTSMPSGVLIRARQNVTTAQESKLSAVDTLFVIDTKQKAIEVDFNLGDTFMLLGESLSTDGLGGGKYEVLESGGDFALDNGLSAKLLSERIRLKAYTESVGTPLISGGLLTIDINAGPVQSIILTENITSIVFANASSDDSTTVQLFLKQDSTGGRSVGFSGFISPGGNAPSISSGADEEDVFVFQTKNGTEWYLFTAGQDFKAIP